MILSNTWFISNPSLGQAEYKGCTLPNPKIIQTNDADVAERSYTYSLGFHLLRTSTDKVRYPVPFRIFHIFSCGESSNKPCPLWEVCVIGLPLAPTFFTSNYFPAFFRWFTWSTEGIFIRNWDVIYPHDPLEFPPKINAPLDIVAGFRAEETEETAQEGPIWALNMGKHSPKSIGFHTDDHHINVPWMNIAVLGYPSFFWAMTLVSLSEWIVSYGVSIKRSVSVNIFVIWKAINWLGQSPSHQPRIPASKSFWFVSQLNSPMVDTCQKSGNSHVFFFFFRPTHMIIVSDISHIYPIIYIYTYIYILIRESPWNFRLNTVNFSQLLNHASTNFSIS